MVPAEPEAIIYEALALRTVEMEAAIGLPVAYPQRPFSKPVGGRYIRMQHLPNRTERRFIGSGDPHRHYGILQLTVVWPVDDDELEPKEYAGRVASYFPADYKMVYSGHVVRSMQRPTVASPIIDDEDLLVPVSVEYESYI